VTIGRQGTDDHARADGKAKVLIRADGSMVFDRIAVEAFRLRGVDAIWVFYSNPVFVLRPRPKEFDWGVPLKRTPGGGLVAEEAADFLQGRGVLPAKHRKYDGQFFAERNVIVITNAGLSKRRTTK
jgi:hypothetical protein